jgi:peptidoglycan/xylan/chitin deacetylase (PgdA/CDA1 family)
MTAMLRRLALVLLLAVSTATVAASPIQVEAQEVPNVPVSEEEVLRGDPTRPLVTLAINVGAGFEPATEMLDILREKGVRTTFFVMGWWADRNPDLLRRIADEGHEVASHGHTVFDLTTVSNAAVAADLEAADASISAATGRSTRPLWSPSAGYRDARVRLVAASLGYRPILWTLDSLDWTREATADSVYERVTTRAVNGSIVVLHFDSPTTTESTAKALGPIVDELRARGLGLVSITELLTS